MAEKLTRENAREGIFVKFEWEDHIWFAKIVNIGFEGQLKFRIGKEKGQVLLLSLDSVKNAVVLNDDELLHEVNSLQCIIEQTAKILSSH